jgi:hypothetical protein
MKSKRDKPGILQKNAGYKKLIFPLIAVFILAFSMGYAFAGDEYPSHRGTAVNDFAKVIDAENAAKMEALAREVLQKTGTAIVVATVSSIGENEDYNLYANGLYQAWGIGKKRRRQRRIDFSNGQRKKTPHRNRLWRGRDSAGRAGWPDSRSICRPVSQRG